ncbi:MAG: ABC transporter ATP-binding protein [Nitrococcus mobilis]|nr:ABC transporter ATP-binding protein [Nitrococcus mobilis]
MSEPVLEVSGLKTWFDTAGGPVRAVDGVDLRIARGETFALLGESGCGKSMTALSIMRLLPAAGRIMAGEVRLGARNLLALPEMAMREVRGRQLAMIFQEPQSSLNPVLSVGMQIAETLRRRGESSHERRVLELLDAVGIPDPPRRALEYPHQLSGGMKQRVMIAIALAGEPELLIADEPTTALDVTIQAQVLALLRDLQRRTGMALLLITHDLGVVAEMADRVAVMYAGHVVEQAPATAFFAQPAHPYSRKLFASLPNLGKRATRLAVIPGSVPSLAREFKACRFEARCDYAWSACRETLPRWLEHEPGRHVRCHLYDPAQAGEPLTDRDFAGDPDKSVADAEPIPARGALLQVDNLKVHFPIHAGVFKRVVGHVRAVDGVSLAIPSGRTLALVGESGCGKTTAGKGILQLLRPSAGSVQYAGEELTRLGGRALRRRRKELQIIFQDPYSSMNPRMMIGDILEEGMIAQRIGQTHSVRLERVAALLAQVGLDADVMRRYPHEFSGGQRQRICIARALAVDPKLIICDEPTSALDVSVQAQILNLLQELQQRLGLSYLFITHNLAVVEYLAHEVAVMYLGRIVEQGTVEEVLHAPRHPYTRALLSAVPTVDPQSRREIIRLAGDLPSPANPPSGCHFHPRCPQAMPQCRKGYPGTTRFSPSHSTHCYLYGDGAYAQDAENGTYAAAKRTERHVIRLR